MSNPEQKEFLLAEYEQLHESLYRTGENVNNAFRLATTLMAAAVGAILVAVSKKIDPHILKLFIASLSLFFLIISTLGSWLLTVNQRGMISKLKAINRIRRYFLECETSNSEYFFLPVSDNIPLAGRMGVRSSIIFSFHFVFLFSLITSISWLLYFSVPIKVSIFIGLPFSILILAFTIFYFYRTNKKINQEPSEII